MLITCPKCQLPTDADKMVDGPQCVYCAMSEERKARKAQAKARRAERQVGHGNCTMTEPEARKHPMFPFFEEFVRDTDACRMDYFEQWSALFAAYVAGASRGIHEKTMGRLP